MWIERALAAAMVAGLVIALLGLWQWFTKPRAPRVAGVMQPAMIDLPKMVDLPTVVVTGRREVIDELGDYYAALRAQVHWVPTRIGRAVLPAPDYESRMLLAKAAARYAGLADVGLSYRDVYGIINAETSWAPRTGASRNGTPNLGIAQFEPATARALGVRNPDDVVEAVHAVALHMKEAALWSRDRLRGLNLGAEQRAMKLREGISIYYNLSTRGRNMWNGMNTAALPFETQRHIANAKFGAREAAMLDAQMHATVARCTPSRLNSCSRITMQTRPGLAPAA